MDLPRLRVEIAKFGVFGDDLCGVDFGVVCDDVGPPFVLVHLLEVNLDEVAILDGPGRVFLLDVLCELAGENRIFAFESYGDLALLDRKSVV